MNEIESQKSYVHKRPEPTTDAPTERAVEIVEMGELLISGPQFIFLGKGFWVEISQIQAVEYTHSELLDHTFLKIFCGESIYDFQGERAKETWVIVQKALELEE